MYFQSTLQKTKHSCYNLFSYLYLLTISWKKYVLSVVTVGRFYYNMVFKPRLDSKLCRNRDETKAQREEIISKLVESRQAILTSISVSTLAKIVFINENVSLKAETIRHKFSFLPKLFYLLIQSKLFR